MKKLFLLLFLCLASPLLTQAQRPIFTKPLVGTAARFEAKFSSVETTPEQTESLLQIYDSVFSWPWDKNTSQWKVSPAQKFINIVYNANKKMVSYLGIIGDGTTYVNDAKTTNTYDANNNQTTSIEESWIAGAWTNLNKLIYTYDANKNMLTFISQNWVSAAWVNLDKTSYTYDANNNLLIELYQSWNGTSWDNQFRRNYLYNASNKRILEIAQLGATTWADYSKDTFIYDNKNNLITDLNFFWDGTDWLNQDRYLFTYDANNNKITELTQNWNGTVWSDMSKYTSTYDANKNLLSVLQQSWNGTLWQNYNLNKSTYDANNFMKSTCYKYYDNAGISILSGDSFYYYFHTAVNGINTPTNASTRFHIYPNPMLTMSTIYLDKSIKNGLLTVVDIAGKEMQSIRFSGQRVDIKKEAMPEGIYFVRILDENSQIVTSKMIVR